MATSSISIEVQGFNRVKGALSDATRDIGQFAQRIGAEGVLGRVSGLLQNPGTWGVAAVTAAGAAVRLFGVEIGSLANEFKDVGAGATYLSESTLEGFQAMASSIESAGDWIHASWAEAMWSIVEDLEGVFGVSFEEALEKAAKAVQSFHTYFVRAVKGVVAVVTTIVAPVAAVFRNLAEVVTRLFHAAGRAIDGDFSGAADAFDGMGAALKEDWASALGSVQASWESLRDEPRALSKEYGRLTGLKDDRKDEPGSGAAKSAAKSVSEGLKFAAAALYGSNDAAKILRQARENVPQMQLEEQRRTGDAVREIASAVAALGVV